MSYETCIDLGVTHVLQCCKGLEKLIAGYCQASQKSCEAEIYDNLTKHYKQYQHEKAGESLGGLHARILAEYMDLKRPGWEVTFDLVQRRVLQWKEGLLKYIGEALDHRAGAPNPCIRDAPLCLFGDVHGCVRGLVQLLWIAGVLRGSKQGFAFTQGRTVVSVGDLVDRGPHSMEAVLLLLSMQLGARDAKSGEVVRLIGNHEMGKLWDKKGVKPHTLGPLDHAILRVLFQNDIDEGLVQIAHAGDWHGQAIVVTHAGIRKNVLQRYADEHHLVIKGSPKPEVKDYWARFDAPALVNWLNEKFRKDAQQDKFLGAKPTLDPVNEAVLYGSGTGASGGLAKEKSGSVLWTHYSQTKDPKDSLFVSKPISADKPIQFVGHTVVDAGIVRRNNIFFIDTGLNSNASQEFIIIDAKAISSVQNKKRSAYPGIDVYRPIAAGDWAVKPLLKHP